MVGQDTDLISRCVDSIQIDCHRSPTWHGHQSAGIGDDVDTRLLASRLDLDVGCCQQEFIDCRAHYCFLLTGFFNEIMGLTS